MNYKQTINSWLLLLSVCLGGCSLSVSKQPTTTMINWTPLSDLPGMSDTASLGVSAPFVGISNGKLLVAGGCNFPDKPVTEGGQKRYYDDIYLFDLGGDTTGIWQKGGHLPQPVAYGASVTTPKGIVCIGGNNQDTSFADVYLLTWDEATATTCIQELPALPASFDNLSATYIDQTLYVAGGNENQQATHAFYALSLTDSGNGVWQKLPDFPGAARVQPVLVAQQSKEGIRIYLAGGFEPISGDLAPQIPTDLLAYHPDTKEWKKEAELPLQADGSPRTLTGGCGVAFGDSSILLTGGVNYNRFLAALDRPRQIEQARSAGDTARLDSLLEEGKQYMHHPVDWYQFNTALLRYNTFSGKWENLGEYESLARAGAGAVVNGNHLFIVNGELKPGIRTPQVNRATLK